MKAVPDKNRDDKVEKLKIPPHSMEAEQSVLGSMLIAPDSWDKVAEVVVEEDFYNRSHRTIFRAIVRLLSANQPVDIITVSEELENHDELEEAGGFTYLGELAQNTPSAANVVAYAEIIKERAITRELIGVAHSIADVGYNPEGRDSSEILDLAETQVFQIAEKRMGSNEGPKDVESVLGKTIDRLEALIKTNKEVTGVSTGYTDLDKKTSGLQGSDLIIVAARPSMGKTTFAMNLCENAMLLEEKPVLVFSLEMPAEQIMMRMLASLSRVDQTKIRTAQLDDEDWARISNTMAMLKDKDNLFVDDSSGLTPMEVRTRARKLARERGGISMIMIDYLQLMRVPSLSDNRTLEIAEISRSLKALAKELNVPVVALSQLNRSLEQRADKRPINSDLRESGSIEQDADLIMFIYRDEVYNENTDLKGISEIILGKQRNGPIGTVRLTFQGQFSRFDNYAGPAYSDE
ncbi:MULTISPECIES: replicative DNA helicase [Alteromonadaceae]|uniref:replicative DNA helicase n=1 Tax=Alteromonadaceae TaxID=72275 RepID=UPI001C0A366E|nr:MULTISPECIES: replicative DNA helicase [unclassified Aliiglaciecola]MBU2879483.1 replicative DNA helicase [Aliiglaciecola lipolytica]MDO6713072.1 replicative DNA helicase [Aliiglaciecola sp. 2_MG-2023]MDO6754162.1 replicative DNA helicase [Aliiglaciecola sp. 1_MG-2023]